MTEAIEAKRKQLVARAEHIRNCKLLTQEEKTFLERLTMQPGEAESWPTDQQSRFCRLATIVLDDFPATK